MTGLVGHAAAYLGTGRTGPSIAASVNIDIPGYVTLIAVVITGLVVIAAVFSRSGEPARRIREWIQAWRGPGTPPPSNPEPIASDTEQDGEAPPSELRPPSKA